MRYLSLLFLLLPALSQAQDCNIKTEKDQFTQQDRLTTGFLQLTNARLSVTADSKELDFFIAASSDKCFDDASTLVVAYDDGRSKATFRNSGSMNCEGLFHFILRNTATSNSNLQRLETKKVRSLVLTNGKVTTTILLNEEQQQRLQTAVGCISKEAKTLIKKP